jgi:hypothetical protein
MIVLFHKRIRIISCALARRQNIPCLRQMALSIKYESSCLFQATACKTFDDRLLPMSILCLLGKTVLRLVLTWLLERREYEKSAHFSRSAQNSP